jgi:hypothetical protein
MGGGVQLLLGAQSRSRTGDLRITSALLYQLSYLGGRGKISNRQVDPET